MKTEKITLFMGGILIVLLAFLIVWQADVLGVSAARLEEDARESQDIESGWEVARAINDDMCAMLFYDEDTHECAYSIYLSGEGVSFGYFFEQGGVDPRMGEGVKGVLFKDKGIALLSLNQEGVSKIVASNNVKQEVVQVNPSEPFVVVLPADCGMITLYDSKDNVVMMHESHKDM